MVFSWSLWIDQEINRAKVVQSGFDPNCEINAHSVENTFENHHVRFLVYVDNIAAFLPEQESCG